MQYLPKKLPVDCDFRVWIARGALHSLMRETIQRLEGGKLNFSPLNWEHSHKVEEEEEAVIRYNGTKQPEGS